MSSKRKRRAISLVQIEEPVSSSKSKRDKKKLDFNQTTEGQASSPDKNVMNLPYTDSQEDLEPVEG